MKKIRHIILGSCLLMSCNSFSDQELWIKVEQAKANNNWDSTLSVSKRILKEYPDSRFAGWAQFAVAESYRFSDRPREALNEYIIFIANYPNMKPQAVSQFLAGYLYSHNFQMFDSARFYFEGFLKKYPDHDLASSVQLELQTMGKSMPAIEEDSLKQKTEKTD